MRVKCKLGGTDPFCEGSNLTHPSDPPALGPVILMIIAWYKRIKYKQGESNYFLQTKWALSPLGSFIFLMKIT